MNVLCLLQLQYISVLDLLLTFKWLMCYYLKKTYQHIKDFKSNGMSNFDITNNSQLFLARTLSLIYGEVNEYKYICIYIQLAEKTTF